MNRIINTALIFSVAVIVGLFVGSAMHLPVAEHIQDNIVAGTPDAPLRLDNEPEWATSWSYPIDPAEGITEPYDIQPAMGYRLYQPTYNSQSPYANDWRFVGVQ